MKCLLLVPLTILLKNVFCEPEVLLKSGSMRFTTDSNSHRIQSIQDVKYFDEVLVNGSQLRVLSPDMPVLFEGAFRNMKNLQILQIPRCKIQEIKPKAFMNLPNLDRIQLQDNLISRIESNIFNFMNISQLFLHRNKIDFIHSEAFDNMPNLHTIKLNANQIRTWDSNWFLDTPKLTDIFIRRNQIWKLEENAFKNIKKLQVGYEENQNSTNIYLSKNRISSIHPQALSELVRLNDFFLDRNNLTDIPQNLFAYIESITYLNLRRNKLENLAQYPFPKITRFKTLDLTRNNLKCISENVATRVDKILLEDNFIDCECLNQLTKAVKEKGKNNTIVVGDCAPNSEDGTENDEEEEDEEDEEMEEEEE
ncbi:hypothetical protein HHI36_013977 [Cryptolaemus montrouzieri]|uniref:Uncharacterized protein n=1 Tax=Cryptolaemus montrouzieri TaxID=559131 RepID=A0ABD2N1H9_9CUCU